MGIRALRKWPMGAGTPSTVLRGFRSMAIKDTDKKRCTDREPNAVRQTSLDAFGTENNSPKDDNTKESNTDRELPPSIRNEVLNRDSEQCRYCNTGEPIADLEVHHVKPVSKGGNNTTENLRTLCERCHTAIHRLGAKDTYSLKILEVVNKETINTPESPEIIQDKYSHDVPEHWDSDEWYDTIEDLEVPPKSYINIKSINNNDYYYFQWRDGDEIKSTYIGRVRP